MTDVDVAVVATSSSSLSSRQPLFLDEPLALEARVAFSLALLVVSFCFIFRENRKTLVT